MNALASLPFVAPSLYGALAEDAGQLRPPFARLLAQSIGVRRLSVFDLHSFSEGPWLRVGRAPGAVHELWLKAALRRRTRVFHASKHSLTLTMSISVAGHVVGALWLAWPSGTIRPEKNALDALESLLGTTLTMATLSRALAQQTTMLDMIRDLSNLLGADADVDATLQKVISYLYQRFNLTLATLSLVALGGSELILKAFEGSSRFPLARDHVWPADCGITGRAIRSGEMQFVEDVAGDPDYVEGNPETQAELILPVRLRGQVIGLINLECADRHTFPRPARMALQALADQVAGAIHLATTNAQLEQVNAATSIVLRELNSSNRRLAQANSRLEELSLRDTLTGIGNRRNFDRALKLFWRESRNSGAPMALLLLDVDHFKAYNDHFGHPAGDQCLRQVAQSVRATLRGRDLIAARYGGEEFAVLVSGADEATARRVAERLQRAIERMAIAHAPSVSSAHVTVSIGVACAVAARGIQPAWLVQRADSALYAAKTMGRNCVQVA